MTKVKNLSNSPHDLVIRIPAMGSVDATFAPDYLEAMRGLGYFEITEDQPEQPRESNKAKAEAKPTKDKGAE